MFLNTDRHARRVAESKQTLNNRDFSKYDESALNGTLLFVLFTINGICLKLQQISKDKYVPFVVLSGRQAK